MKPDRAKKTAPTAIFVARNIDREISASGTLSTETLSKKDNK